MKVLGNLTVNKDSDAIYPFGANIQNETDTVLGTPVVREIYGDVLMNIYKILELTNVIPTNTEDNDSTQYQIVEALKKLPNSLNDIEQILSLNGSVWSVPFDLSILPNKYFFIARASESYVSGTSYTFKGTGSLELPFTSNGFNASDEVLVIIDTSGVRAYSLSLLSSGPSQVFTMMPNVLKYSNGSKLYYLNNGKLYTNDLSVVDIQNNIRVNQSDGTLVLQNAFIMQGHVVCVVKNPSTVNYEFYAFDLLDLGTVISLTCDVSQTPSKDYLPEFYAYLDYLYVTNGMNNTANDYKITKLYFDLGDNNLDLTSTDNLDVSFVKDSNGAIKDGFLYIFESNNLSRFNLSTGVKQDLGDYPDLNGEIFTLADELYFSTGEVANKLGY